MKTLFWLFVAIDVIVVGLFALLALAAAGPSRTNPIAALLYPAIAGSILAAAIWLFTHAQAPGARLLATLIAGLPIIVVLVGQGTSFLELRNYRDSSGNIREFRSDALREIEAAITRHDAAAVAAAAKGVDVNTPGISGATVLVLALRELDKAPDQLDIVKSLLAAGADPNIGPSELPLQVAIGASRTAGLEPVRLLLEAGANPNATSEWGDPVYFIGTGSGIDVEVMKMLLARGADLQIKDSQGRGPVADAVITSNWPVLLLLLQRGAPWREEKGPGGVPVRAYLEAEAASGSAKGLDDVLAFFRAADGADPR